MLQKIGKINVKKQLTQSMICCILLKVATRANSLRGVAQSGSARALGAWGRRFESSHPDQYDWLFSWRLRCIILVP